MNYFGSVGVDLETYDCLCRQSKRNSISFLVLIINYRGSLRGKLGGDGDSDSKQVFYHSHYTRDGDLNSRPTSR